MNAWKIEIALSVVLALGLLSGGCGKKEEVEPSGLEGIQGDVIVSISGNTLTVIAPVGIQMFTLDPQDTVVVRGMTPNEVYRFLVRKAAGNLLKHIVAYWNSEAGDYTLVIFRDEGHARELGVNPRMEQGKWTATMREVAVALSFTGSVEDVKRSLADAMKDPELTSFNFESFFNTTFSNVESVSFNLIPSSVKKTVEITQGRIIEIDAITGRPEVLRQVRTLAWKEMMGEVAIHK